MFTGFQAHQNAAFKWIWILTGSIAAYFTFQSVAVAQENSNTLYDENSRVYESEIVSVEEILYEHSSYGGKRSVVAGDVTSNPEDIFRAKVVAVINKADRGSTMQTMRLYVDGALQHTWKVSTGREKKETAKSGRVYFTVTPQGYFRPTWITPLHKSKTWQADMPFSVFFIGGIATHGTTITDKLGTRASGGCVRLEMANAKRFFQLVKGTGKTSVNKISRWGENVQDKLGNQEKETNYDVLIIVENVI